LYLAALVIVIAAISQAAIAAYWPNLAPEDAKKIMPVSQLKRGMRGYGLTVFHGTKIEKFDVEILGVLTKMNTGRDLILVRVGGGPINTRQTGIIGGMSGSPVYIGGKLIGAISYGASFAKEPVGMVTPIADMLEAWDPNLPARASGYSSPQSLPTPMSVGGKSVDKVAIDPAESAPRGVEDGTLYMRPLMTTMMVSGISQKGLAALSDILRPYNIQPVAGPGGAANPKAAPNVDLVPGAAIGMSLISGDIDMTGIGTVTYRRGNKIVAFGHPMLGIGAVDAPMTTAYIADVLSSYQVSTKLGFPIKMVGHIFQDRPWCIAGSMGSACNMIPVTITVNDDSTKRDRTFHVRVINHPLLAPKLISMVASEAISEMHPTPGDATAMVSYDITADQVGKISRSNVFFDPASVDGVAAMDMSALLQLLSNNKFQPLDIKSASMNVRIIGKRNTATIDRIFVKKSEFEPGETMEVGVVLRPYKQDRITKTLKIKIPATAPDGKLLLTVRGGAMPMGMAVAPAASAGEAPGADPSAEADISAGGGMMVDPGMANADNVKQLIDKYLEHEKNNEIVLQLQLRNMAVNVAGEKLGGMPNAIADIMKSSRNSGLKLEKEEVKQVYPDDAIIYGSARLMIDVKKKSLDEGKTIMKSSSADSSDSSESSSSSTSIDSPSPSFDSSDYSGGDAGDMMMAMDAQSGPIDLKSTAPVKEKTVTVEKKAPATPAAADDSSKTNDTSAAPAADQPAAPKTNVKTVVRQMTTWLQKSQAEFAKGTFAGVSASSENKLELAPTLRKLVETPEQYVWCLASAKEGVYAGTGNSGKVYKISDSGDMKTFYETGELEVNSIARDSSGNVYVGTSPHGKIFKIAPNGTGKLLYKTSEKYVLAMALDPEGNLYAGVGDAGKVYKITPEGKASVFTEINEQQVLSLSWDPHGSLLIGTGINGVVYRADRSGNTRPIFDAPEDSITAVVSDGNGNTYAGTSPKGVVYKIAPDGRSKTLYTKNTRVLSMVCDSKNNVYAVSDGTLVKISPDGTVTQLDSSKEKVQFLSLALNEAANEIYASTGNIGSVYVSKCCDARGTYESPVHDAKMISKWGRIKWVAETPEGTTVEVRTRTGNVATPDSTWSKWSAPYRDASGDTIVGTPGRYIQYQVTLTATNADVSPKVSTVSVSYLTPNQAPDVKLTSPTSVDVWAGKETIKWIGTDPDKDTLTYDVYYSQNGGKDWTALVGGMGGAKTAKSDIPTKPAADILGKVKTELNKSNDIPNDMKTPFTVGMKDVPQTGSTSSAGNSSTSTSYTWDTTKVDDGSYVVKVVASDKTSNADDPLTDTAISEPFIICNNGPELNLTDKNTEMKAVGSATITGTATSKLVDVVGVQYRVDGGDWAAAMADNGMFDSPNESFTIKTTSLSSGTHKVEVQAIDAAGNATSQTVEVKVS